jgi:hypothetical protein
MFHSDAYWEHQQAHFIFSIYRFALEQSKHINKKYTYIIFA